MKMMKKNRSKRPLPLTLIAWWIIIVEAIVAPLRIFLLSCSDLAGGSVSLWIWQLPIALALGAAVLLDVVLFVAGLAMLCRRSWGRILALIVLPILYVSQNALSDIWFPQKSFSLAASCVFFIILFSPSVRRYFATNKRGDADASETKNADDSGRRTKKRAGNVFAFLLLASAIWFSALQVLEDPIMIGMIELCAPDLIPARKLRKNLNSSNPDLVIETIAIFKRRKDSSALDVVIPFLQSENPRLWTMSALYVGSFNKEEAVPYLIKALRYWSPRSDNIRVSQLQSITGQTFGNNFDHWRAWWKSEHPDVEFDWESNLGVRSRIEKKELTDD